MQTIRKFEYKSAGYADKRTCTKCGQLRGLSDFLTYMSEQQLDRWGYTKKFIAGFTDIYGKFHRGYRRTVKTNAEGKRLVMSVKCVDCRKPDPKPKHPKAKGTFKVVMDQITTRRKRINALKVGANYLKLPLITHNERMYYIGIAQLMLGQAANNAREIRKLGRQMPYTKREKHRWELLLSPIQREQLLAAHAAVAWGSKVPDVF